MEHGIIDSDYVDNVDNDGNIGLSIKNTSEYVVEIMRGERIAQGIFFNYKITDDDNANGQRIGRNGFDRSIVGGNKRENLLRRKL